ncbi:uracil-DNA glycosylase [Thioalkalivibrio thiocyanodenitrificans]|uniref:uracil-DNA glycosylase n=1 Tax=Thioalkalivibrio thiocyanodenitrificans TaxID=243063 RepID=UPI00037CD462|nr:uracil-DNA glycosylase [Thioalkalivibrio thiocyanodenitrificans]
MALDAFFSLICDNPYNSDWVFNPWRDRCFDFDLCEAAPRQRLDRLKRHLECKHPTRILLGEAPGYQGCRYSGVAFTSERLLVEGVIPRIEPTPRITSRERPFSEPSATIIWGILEELGVAHETLLWNAFPWHPHGPGASLTNRTPSIKELRMGVGALEALLAHFQGVQVLALGRSAEKTLRMLGVSPKAALRHPSMGGAQRFREGLRDLSAASA